MVVVFVKLNNYFGVKVIWRGGVNKIIVVKDFILFFCGGLGFEPLPHYYLHESVIQYQIMLLMLSFLTIGDLSFIYYQKATITRFIFPTFYKI